MRRLFAASLLIVTCLPLPLLADPAVVVSKVHVDTKTADDLEVTLPTTPGVSFALVLDQPVATIIGIDEKNSRLISATDDKKTDFAKTAADGWLTTGSSRVAANRHKIAVPITFSTVPAAGATSIAFKADLVLSLGSNEMADTVKLFDFAKGASAKFGKHTIDLRQGPPATFDDAKGQRVSVMLNEYGTWLKTIEFFNKAGKPIKATESSPSAFDATVTREFLLDTDQKSASVRLTYFQKVEQTTMPVNVKIGLGQQ